MRRSAAVEQRLRRYSAQACRSQAQLVQWVGAPVPGSDTIDLSLSHAISDEVLASLRGLAHVRDLKQTDGDLKLRVDNGGELLPQLLDVLRQKEVGVTSVSLSRVTLEDTFLYFTGRSLREEAPVHGVVPGRF